MMMVLMWVRWYVFPCMLICAGSVLRLFQFPLLLVGDKIYFARDSASYTAFGNIFIHVI